MVTATDTRCRSCDCSLELVLDLGSQPLANAYCTTTDHICPTYPLALMYCPECTLLQLRDAVEPETLFTDYAFRTSASLPAVEHFRDMAADLTLDYRLNPDDLVVDIGSNDGTFLSFLDTRRVGVDPAFGAAKAPTIVRYFDASVAEEILVRHGKAKLVTMANILTHVPDPRQTLMDAASMLAEDGAIIVEFPDASKLLEGTHFDLVYHEHRYYFTEYSLSRILPDGMSLRVVERIDVHGGSLRCHIVWGEQSWTWPSSPLPVTGFAAAVKANVELLKQRIEGRRVVGYAAPAKATVLLNYANIHLPYVVDSTPTKQGKYIPGVHTSIRPESELELDTPVLILAWNYASQIAERLGNREWFTL